MEVSSVFLIPNIQFLHSALWNEQGTNAANCASSPSVWSVHHFICKSKKQALQGRVHAFRPPDGSSQTDEKTTCYNCLGWKPSNINITSPPAMCDKVHGLLSALHILFICFCLTVLQFRCSYPEQVYRILLTTTPLKILRCLLFLYESGRDVMILLFLYERVWEMSWYSQNDNSWV